MKKILMLMLLLGSFAFGKSLSIKTGKSDRCVPADSKIHYQGIDSFNEGYYAHLYNYHFIQIKLYTILQVKIKFHLI